MGLAVMGVPAGSQSVTEESKGAEKVSRVGDGFSGSIQVQTRKIKTLWSDP
jgi:hypothetical protein